MKHLYFARHGESYINIQNVFATRLGTKNDLGLTETGTTQAHRAADSLASHGPKIDLLISSPLKRARETAEIIADKIGYNPANILINDLLIEIQYGELEGSPWNEFWQSGQTYADLGTYEGAETIEMLQSRAQKALAYLESLPAENILVVSHSGFGRALRRVIENRPYTDEFAGATSLPHAEVMQLL